MKCTTCGKTTLFGKSIMLPDNDHVMKIKRVCKECYNTFSKNIEVIQK